jgi:hypothetical protein
MMISPQSYVNSLKNKSYAALIRERKRLVAWINRYERNEMAGDRTGVEWGICPMPDVQYQCNLLYLAELCAFMSHKYNLDYVGEDRTLADDTSIAKGELQ